MFIAIDQCQFTLTKCFYYIDTEIRLKSVNFSKFHLVDHYWISINLVTTIQNSFLIPGTLSKIVIVNFLLFYSPFLLIIEATFHFKNIRKA